MKKNELNRFGDTSFRIKNQVNFYFNIIEIIENKNIKTTDDLVNQIIEKRIVNYNKKSWEERSRINFLTKQLKRFGILEKDNKNIIKTKISKNINNFTKEDINIFFEVTGLDLINIIFGFLMINDSKYGEYFKIFIEFLNDEKEEYFDENKIAFFETLESKKDIDFLKKIDFNCFQLNFINLLFKDINLDTIKSYINDEIKFKDLIKNTDFNFKKPLKEINEIKKFIKEINSNKNNLTNQNIKLFLSENKQLKREIKSIEKFFNISTNEILKNEFNLLNLFLKNKKRELFFKDYLDINKRWFTQINLLQICGGKKLKINKKYLKIYSYLSKYNLKTDLVEIINEIKTKFKNTTSEIKTYPYKKEEVLEIFKEINKETYNEDKIFKKLNIFNVSMPTIFEYLVNLAFSLSYGYSVYDFRNKYSNTILDENLKPRRHACGGQSDGFIEDNEYQSDILFSTLESTMLKNLFSEKEPIQRHAIKLFEKKLKTDIPNCIFVCKEKINKDNIINFSSKSQSRYWNDTSKSVRIIILDLNMLITLFEKNKLFKLLRTAINRLPFAEESEPIVNIENWYRELITNI